LQHANVSRSTDVHDDVVVRDPHWDTGLASPLQTRVSAVSSPTD
jgi:hypothetical protein